MQPALVHFLMLSSFCIGRHENTGYVTGDYVKASSSLTDVESLGLFSLHFLQPRPLTQKKKKTKKKKKQKQNKTQPQINQFHRQNNQSA